MRIRVQKMPLNVEKLLIMLAISKKMRTFAVVFIVHDSCARVNK